MPKVWIEADERYPVYEYSERISPAEGGIEVDDETYARWERVTAEYHAVQAELAALHEAEHRRWLAAHGI